VGPSPFIGSLSGLISAIIWGSGDFAGGVATRRHSPYQVLAMAALSGAVVLVLLALAWGDPLPTQVDALWAAAGGIGGAIGIVALYRGLSLGNAALVAPTTSVTATLVPVLFQLVRRDPPSAGQLAGFAIALLGIWLVSQAPAENPTGQRHGLWLALLAGLGFGSFFVLVGQVGPGGAFAPLVVARSAALGLALLILGLRRERMPAFNSNPIALLAGVLDAGGNVFYLLATRYTRLDVAAVLSSLYPAATVILARVVTHEVISRRQWVGVCVCLVAVVMIVSL
jgi:drug/metabolite transporter (DMT)-like permease